MAVDGTTSLVFGFCGHRFGAIMSSTLVGPSKRWISGECIFNSAALQSTLLAVLKLTYIYIYIHIIWNSVDRFKFYCRVVASTSFWSFSPWEWARMDTWNTLMNSCGTVWNTKRLGVFAVVSPNYLRIDSF